MENDNNKKGYCGGARNEDRVVTARYCTLVGFFSFFSAGVCFCMAAGFGERRAATYACDVNWVNSSGDTVELNDARLTGEEARRYALMLCDGYEANREKFQHYICRGEVRWGRLKVSLSLPDLKELLGTDDGFLEAARQGMVVPSIRECWKGTGYILEVLDVRSGNLRRFISTAVAEKPGEPVLPGPYAPDGTAYCNGGRELLTDGKYFFIKGVTIGNLMGEVSKDPDFDQLVIFSSWNQRVWGWVSPMDQLRAYIERVLPDPAKRATLTVRRNVPKIGFLTSEVVYDSPYSRETWWVCEEKGYIAVLKESVNKEDGYISRHICDDVRRVGRRGWWPMHLIQFGDSGNGIELRVLEVDADRRPARDMFTLTLSHASVSVRDPEFLRWPLRIEGQKQLTVEDIPKLLARYYGQPEPPKRRPLWRRAATVAVVALLVVGGGWYAYLQYRRRR